LNAFLAAKQPDTMNITHIMKESWEIGTDWEADWSHDAASPSADTRAWYM